MSYRRIASTVGLALLAGCYGPVDDQTAASCSVEGQCLPGYVCAQNYCVPQAELDEPQSIGPNGGEVFGPYGTVLLIPPGALSEMTTIEISLGSRGTYVADAELISRARTISPAGVKLAVPATLLIPVPTMASDEMPGIRVWHTSSANLDKWQRLDGHGEPQMAVAETLEFGTFAAGRSR